MRPSENPNLALPDAGCGSGFRVGKLTVHLGIDAGASAKRTR